MLFLFVSCLVIGDWRLFVTVWDLGPWKKGFRLWDLWVFTPPPLPSLKLAFAKATLRQATVGCGPEGMMRVEFYWRGLACPMDSHILLSFLGGS